MLQLERTHRGGKATGLVVTGPLRAAVEVTGRERVAAACGIDYARRLVGGDVVEFALGLNRRTVAAQRDDHLLDAHLGNGFRCLADVLQTGDYPRLLFVQLENAGAS